MKVVVINPNTPFLINEKVFPNIGAVRVATALSKEHDVEFIDLAGRNDGEEVMKQIAHKYDCYLFTSTTPAFPYTYTLFKRLKITNPKAKTIIGGAHASAISSLRRRGIKDINIERLEEFDTIFEGEGEDITNIFTPGWQKGKLIHNIDTTPIPNWGFIDPKSYVYNMNGRRTTNIQTQRGCPYQCTFCCGRDIEMYNKVRSHSPERVLQEMDLLHKKYGFSSFMWYDDEIGVDINRLEILCKELEKRKYQHRGFVRSDIVVKHPEIVEWLKKAGFVKLCVGVESGSDRVLKIIKKGVTSEMNLQARRIIGNAGIHYEAFTLLGLPTETEEDVQMTKEWLLKAKPDDFDINVVTPYPGSKIYDDSVPSNRFKKYGWVYRKLYFNKSDYSQTQSFYKGIGGKSAVDTRTETMTSERLHQLREEIQCIK